MIGVIMQGVIAIIALILFAIILLAIGYSIGRLYAKKDAGFNSVEVKEVKTDSDTW